MISFDKTEFDLGNVVYGTVKSATAIVTNDSDEAVILSPANSSCSCTTGYVQSPTLAPKSTTEFRIDFNTRKAGIGSNQVKSIALNYSINRQQHSQIFRFKANVI